MITNSPTYRLTNRESHMKKITLIATLFLSLIASAQTEKTIDTLANQPVSTFSFLLYKLYHSTRCNMWLEYQQSTVRKQCMRLFPIYNTENNTIAIEFSILKDEQDRKDKKYRKLFYKGTKASKEKFLKAEMEQLITKLGLSKNSNDNYHSGLIDEIWQGSDVTKTIITALKDRIIFKVKFSYENGKHHKGPHRLIYRGSYDLERKVNISITQSDILL